MRQIIYTLIVVLALFPFTAAAKHVINLTEVRKPSGIYVDKNNKHLYVVEFPSIYIYSLKDYGLVHTFGKKGEGPGEFLRYARVHFLADTILIQSGLKFSYYSKDWKYLKEQKTPMTFDRGVKPFGDRLVASYTVPNLDKQEQIDQTVNLHDWDCKMLKEIYRQRYYFKIGIKVNAIYLPEVDRRSGVRFFVQQDKIFVEADDGETGTIYVYDREGKKLYDIHHQFEKLKVTAEHKKAVEDWYKLKRRRLLMLVERRGWLYYPDYFPAVRYLNIVDSKIYAIPYKKKEGKLQLFIFDLKGKLLEQMDAPIVEETPFSFYPNTIAAGKLYQLVDDMEEEWELHIHELK
jgi:hypothetical protein